MNKYFLRSTSDSGKTPKHIQSFKIPSLLAIIKAAYLNSPIWPYIPKSLRCFYCQRYGHSKVLCRTSINCTSCAEVGRNDKIMKMLNVVLTEKIITAFSICYTAWLF